MVGHMKKYLLKYTRMIVEANFFMNYSSALCWIHSSQAAMGATSFFIIDFHCWVSEFFFVSHQDSECHSAIFLLEK